MSKVDKKEQLQEIIFKGMKKGVVIVEQFNIGGQKAIKHKFIGPNQIEYYMTRLQYNYNSDLTTSKSYIDRNGKENAHTIIWAEVTSPNTEIRPASHYGADYNLQSDFNGKTTQVLDRIKQNNKNLENIEKTGGSK